jgi:hypothetical protein
VESNQSISIEVVVVSFFNQNHSSLELGGHFGGSDERSFNLEAQLLKLFDLAVGRLGCLSDD